jgi:hypothetical protein
MALVAVFTVSAVAAWAQTPECTDDFKTATYSKWYDNRKDNQDAAYEAAKEYVKVCPTDESQYATVLKKFIADYDKIHTNQKLAQDFETAVKNNNYAQQVQLGKQLTAANPDSTIVYIYMANAGLNDANLSADALQAAKKAIELIEGGKPFTPAYNTKDQALAAMNYVIAKVTVKSSAADAIPYFIKAAKYDSPLKKTAQLYNELAAAYAEQVDKLTNEYKQHIGKPETTESKLVLANLDQAIDAQIDALARATAFADAANKPALMARLTDVYKDRKKSDAGLNELVTGILSKPLPDPPKPITELPTPPTPTGTPTPAATAPGGAPTTGAAPSAAKPSTSTSPTSTGSRSTGTSPTGSSTTGAKPAASPSPTPKPPSRRTNHRG